MTDAHLPTAPQTVRASELLEGDDEGFVINAYLALQRQWPDPGGFGHYHWLLSQRPQARLEVLREIAPAARRTLVVQSPDHPGETEERQRTQSAAADLGLAMGGGTDAAIAASFTARDGLRATWAYRSLVARNLVLEFLEEPAQAEVA